MRYVFDVFSEFFAPHIYDVLTKTLPFVLLNNS